MPNMPQLNSLHYGDCLEVMKQWPDESVDLIYLDPPLIATQNIINYMIPEMTIEAPEMPNCKRLTILGNGMPRRLHGYRICVMP